LEYLKELYNGYDEFINEISKVIPVIKVNWNQFRTAEVVGKSANLTLTRRWLR
jgi:deoxyadenosine kinase